MAMNPISRLQSRISRGTRRRRARLFGRLFAVTPRTRILDLGSSDGSHIATLLQGMPVAPENVFIADIREDLLEEGRRRFGFHPVLIPESGQLSFEDRSFDIVFCSSVIEHVTVPKERVWEERSGTEFRQLSRIRQAEFAREIRRIAVGYWVQTPYRWFPIESHTWLPLVGWLPRSLQVPLLRLTNRVWVKRTKPDWNLLVAKDMKNLFPDADIIFERLCGLTKSLIAVKRARDTD